MINELIIREANAEDWLQIVSIYNYYIINSVFNFELAPYSLERRLPWFNHFSKDSPCQLLVSCNNKSEVLGYSSTTYFSPIGGYETSLNISIYCKPEYQGRGLGSLMLNRIIKTSKSSQRVHRLYGGITVPNELSMKLFKKFEFKQVAHFTEVGKKFDRYWDVIWFEKKISLNE